MTEGQMDWEVVVVGAGAAGFLAAITAARDGRRTIVFESTRDGGRKILIAGGGRCNILPSQASPERFVTASSPNTLRKILRSWPLSEQVAFFEDVLGQPLVREEETGKLFPASNRARDVRDALVAEARRSGVHLEFGCRVSAIRPSKSPEPGWVTTLQSGAVARSSAVIIGTGGLSVPATGSDGHGLRMLDRLGITIHETYPALTPLTLDPPVHAHLAGVSLPVTLRARSGRSRFETHGGFLFTHRGYSGPSVLDASHLATHGEQGAHRSRIAVSWTPAVGMEEWDERLRTGRGTVGRTLERELPNRLVAQLLSESDVEPGTRISQLTREARQRLVDLVCDYPLKWTGDEGYKKAEVTGGGVALSEINPVTMEVRQHRGLFLCGEVLDAFGPIGGHNFMWAWATGRAAGAGASASVAAGSFSA